MNTRTISSVHNGFQLWTLDFFFICGIAPSQSDARYGIGQP